MGFLDWINGAGRTLKSGFEDFGRKAKKGFEDFGNQIKDNALPVLEKVSDAIHTGAGYVNKGLGYAMPVLGMIPGVGQAARLAQTVASGIGAGTGLASDALHAANNPSGGNVFKALQGAAGALPPQYKTAVQPYLNGAAKIAGQ